MIVGLSEVPFKLLQSTWMANKSGNGYTYRYVDYCSVVPLLGHLNQVR